MATKKSFHLRWNNHLQNLQSLFENLYNEQSLVDVTLSCSDGMLYGHKLVLSACSPYFEQVLRDNPCKHPIMILKGIKQSDMQKLLEYMYVGAIDVVEDDLEKLLDTASELQIKGLATSNKKSFDRRPSPKAQQGSKGRSPSPKPQQALSWEPQTVMDISELNQSETGSECKVNSRANSTEETTERSKPFVDEQQTRKETAVQTPFQNEFNQNIKEEFPDEDGVENGVEKEFGPVECIDESFDHVENMELKFDNNLIKTPEFDDMTYFCHLCSRGFDKKGSLQRHMMTHAGVKPHNCNFCNLSFLRLSHLQRHIRVHTGERPYSCAKCPKQFSRSDKLRQHNILQHNEANSRVLKPRGRPRKLVDFEGLHFPFAPQSIVSPPQSVAVKGKRPRGRPRKHPEFYPPPSTSFADVPLNTLYPVTISPVPLNSTI